MLRDLLEWSCGLVHTCVSVVFPTLARALRDAVGRLSCTVGEESGSRGIGIEPLVEEQAHERYRPSESSHRQRFRGLSGR